MTDQQRADLCKREGYPLDTTPALDRLAAQGIWFNKAYTSIPVCTAARVSMLTGRFPSANRVRTNYNEHDLYATTDLFKHFRSLGYRTALCGKNHTYLTAKDADYWFEAHHVGTDDKPDSLAHKEFDAYVRQMKMHLATAPTPFPLEHQLPHRIVNHAQQFLDTPSDKPFLMWLSFPEPHNPYQCPEPYFSMFPPDSLPKIQTSAADLPAKGFPYQWVRDSFEKTFPGYAQTIDRARANYHGMLRMIDDQVARFLAYLDSKKLRENTIILFLSDHGDFVGEYGLLRKGPELPEPLARIPFSVTGPGIRATPAPGGVPQPHPAHISITDIFPTLCHAAGSPIPEGVQGRSLWPLLTGQPYPAEEFASAYSEHGFGGFPYDGTEPLDPAKDGRFPPGGTGVPPVSSSSSPPAESAAWGRFDCLNSWTQSGTLRLVRKDNWKLLLNAQGRGQLYNLATDPHELHNLFNHPDHKTIQAELTQQLALWLLRTSDPLPIPRTASNGRRYIPKTHPLNYSLPEFTL